MPYRLSRARREFEREVKQLIADLRQAHRTGAADARMRSHVMCSCVLLCMGRLEVYLQDVISEWIIALGQGTTPCSALPSRLRALYVHDGAVSTAYRNYFVLDDEGRFLDAIADTFGANGYQLVAPSGTVPRLHPGRMTDKKYPSPKNVKRLFSRLGIPNVFQRLNGRARSNMEIALQSFNDIRTAVAHDGVLPGASHRDINRHLKEMMRLVLHLDRVFYAHVLQHGGQTTWPS